MPPTWQPGCIGILSEEIILLAGCGRLQQVVSLKITKEPQHLPESLVFPKEEMIRKN